MLLEKRQGACSYEEFMHIVYVCDKSLNSSWMALHSRLTPADQGREIVPVPTTWTSPDTTIPCDVST